MYHTSHWVFLMGSGVFFGLEKQDDNVIIIIIKSLWCHKMGSYFASSFRRYFEILKLLIFSILILPVYIVPLSFMSCLICFSCFDMQGPTISPVFCKSDGRVVADYYAIVICVPKKLLYKSVQQLRAVWHFFSLLNVHAAKIITTEELVLLAYPPTSACAHTGVGQGLLIFSLFILLDIRTYICSVLDTMPTTVSQFSFIWGRV